MNIGIPTLVLAVLAISQIQPAYGHEDKSPPPAPGMNRFDYAPNFYANDRPTGRRPQSFNPSVYQGSMPKGSSFLGLGPQMLNPSAQPTFQPPSTIMSATPSLRVPATFRKQFGAPLTAVALPIKGLPSKANKIPQQPALKPSRSMHSTRSVVATLKKKRPAVAIASAPAKHIEGYGGTGYAPGAYVPMRFGSSSESLVNGRVVK